MIRNTFMVIVIALLVISRIPKTIIVNSGIETFEIATVTNYSEIDSCHYRTLQGCLTKSGQVAQRGAAACPRDIKIGTKIIISDQTYTCLDWYSTYLSRRYDLFVGYGSKSYEEAKQFGVQHKMVTIYKQ